MGETGNTLAIGKIFSQENIVFAGVGMLMYYHQWRTRASHGAKYTQRVVVAEGREVYFLRGGRGPWLSSETLVMEGINFD